MESEVSPRYEGDGYAEFGTPTIRVSGPTVVSADASGLTTAEMRVDKVLTAPSIDEGIAQLSRDFFDSEGRLKSCILRVDCADGYFSATKHIFRSPSIDEPNLKASIVFDCRLGEFIASDGLAAYWSVPLSNFRASFRPAQLSRKIVHPLRGSDDSPMSTFEFLGQLGFVQFLPGYEELLQKVEGGDRKSAVTALMVGAVAGHAIAWEGLDSWFPFEFLSLLSFASGSSVGSPWIEFFDADAHLLRRIHIQLGAKEYQPGHSFLHDVIHQGGVGKLLTCGGRSPELRKTYLKVAMNHLLLGVRRQSQTLEDRISHLTGALEALARRHGLGTQNLLEDADDSIKERVKNVLRSASLQIAEIAREQDALGKVNLASALRRVGERAISNSANTVRDFGLTVLSLLDCLNLEDAKVVDAYYKKNPRADGRRWDQVLSYYRGVCKHGDAFRIREREHSAIEIYRISNHLADIAARIILKELGYDGQYRPATATWQESRTLDWVGPSTTAATLGYGRDED